MTETEKYESKNRTLLLYVLFVFCSVFFSAAAIHAADMTNIQAHAGASMLAPENTRAAFIAAKSAGADGVETDVRMTKDHKLVLSHDDFIDETSDGHGNISEMTLEELKEYDFGSWYGEKYAGESILTLEEFFEIVRELDFKVINLEMKPMAGNGDFFVRSLADEIRKSGLGDRVMVSSFDKSMLYRIKKYAPHINVALLTVPNLSALSLLNLTYYLPKDKALSDYTEEDIQDIPEIVEMALRGFGAKGEKPETLMLGVVKAIADIAPPLSTWSDVEELIFEQKDLVRYVDCLDFVPDYLNCHYNCLSDELMEAMRLRGIKVNVWTPDTEYWLQRTISFHPEGIITNQPETALRLLNQPVKEETDQ